MVDTPKPGEAAAQAAPATTDGTTEFRSAFAEASKARNEGKSPPAQAASASLDQAGQSGAAQPAAIVAEPAQGAGKAAEPAGSAGEQPKPADRSAGGGKKDPFADAAPELREAYASRGKEIARLRNRIHELNRPAQGAPAQAAAGTGEGGPAKPRKERAAEKLKEVREDYPSVAAPIADELEEQAKELDDLRSQVASLTNKDASEKELKVFSSEHPDWKTVVSSEEFGNWALSQSADVQEALRRNGKVVVDGAEAADIVSRFKSDTGYSAGGAKTPAAGAAGEPSPEDKLRARQRETSIAPSIQGGPGAAQGAPDDDFSANFKAAAAEKARQRQAERQGLRRA